MRASLDRYLKTRLYEVKRPLVSTQCGDPVMTDAQADASTLGTPVIEWDYEPSRLPSAGADPWLGLVPQMEHAYMISVSAPGAPPVTMKVWDMPRFWVPFIYRNRPLEALARTELDRHFGTNDYEFCFVQCDGVWGFGRLHGRTAAVMVEAWGESHRVATPHGVQTGSKLKWWLSHPLGQE